MFTVVHACIIPTVTEGARGSLLKKTKKKQKSELETPLKKKSILHVFLLLVDDI